MTVDTQSEAGAWRREMLSGPLTIAQLREVVAELQHCLNVARVNFELLRKQNLKLVKRLATVQDERAAATTLITRLAACLREFLDPAFKAHCGDTVCDECTEQVELRELLALMDGFLRKQFGSTSEAP